MTTEAREFIRNLYESCLHRAPDEAAYAYWVDKLEGGYTPFVVAHEITNCEEANLYRLPKYFCPPGHFYSPIVDRAEAEAHLQRCLTEEGECPDEIAGIRLTKRGMIAKWYDLVEHMRSIPFSVTEFNGWRYKIHNDAFGYGDGYALFGMINKYKPKTIIEIGSGWSSACALDSTEHLSLDCNFHFIEPYPQLLKTLIDSERPNINILDCGVQSVPLDLFSNLKLGDFLFIDSTHVLKTGSDVCFELFEILPRLESGVVVHIHDMFWPFEYPDHWVLGDNRSWNELYAVRAFLTENDEWEILMFNDYMRKCGSAEVANSFPEFLVNSGGSLWLQKR